MARPLRLEFAGALYHVTARGNAQNDIYQSDEDRQAFLALLADVCNGCHWLCHAYCLMDNHYHLLIETPDANLAKGMRQLNGIYTQRFNRTHGRVGHLFQGRYKAIVIERDSYLLELARYIVLNPVRARMVRSAKDWPWSSYRATAGQVECFSWLHTKWLLAAFGERKSLACERYRQFVSAGKNQPAPWEYLSNQVFLGGEAFVERMLLSIDDKKDLSEIPLSQRRAKPRSINEYVSVSKNRNEAMVKAYASGGYTLKEVGEYFGLHYATVSRIVNNTKNKT